MVGSGAKEGDENRGQMLLGHAFVDIGASFTGNEDEGRKPRVIKPATSGIPVHNLHGHSRCLPSLFKERSKL